MVDTESRSGREQPAPQEAQHPRDPAVEGLGSVCPSARTPRVSMSDQQPAPSTGEAATTDLPTLLRRGTHHTVYDPDLLAGTAHILTADGKTTHRHSSTHGLLIIGLILACAIGTPLLLADDGRWFIVWAFLGGVGGFAVAAIVNAFVDPDPVDAYKKRHAGAEPSVEVGPDDVRASTLCRLAADVAASRAWKHGHIDPDRLLGASLWAAVHSARDLEQRRQHLEADEAAGTPESVLHATREEIASADADLDHVETNLREIRRLARELDARSALPAGPGALPAPGTATGLTGQAVAGTDALLAQSGALRDLL